MKELTKLWGDFGSMPADKGNIYVTKRHYLHKLSDPKQSGPNLFLSINNLSGSINILTDKEGQVLQSIMDNSISGNDIPDHFYNRLRKLGYLFPNKQLEEIAYQMVVNHHRNLNYLNNKITTYFSLDTRCAMGCSYCFQDHANVTSQSSFEVSRMDKDSLGTAFKALDLIQGMHQKEVDFVGGFGGEPLQERHWEINQVFMNHAKERSYPVIYFSNLAMLGKKIRALLADRAEQIRVIATTIDGVGETHDRLRTLHQSFTKTVENIDFFLNAGLKVMARTNILPANVDNVPKVADFYAERGWFDYPNFKGTVSRVIDRKHKDQTLFTEDEALSAWLDLREKNPNVRKLYNYKIAFSLFNILEALKQREDIGNIAGGDGDNFSVYISPIISSCTTDNGISYTFTGSPNNSIYACPVASCFKSHRIGSHTPYLSFDEVAAKHWGEQQYIDSHRGIYSFDICRSCEGATLCGSNCPLEAVYENGHNHTVYCKNINSIVRKFFKRESGRLYSMCKRLM